MFIMNDIQIIDNLSFDYNAGYGRGGFVVTTDRFTLYEEDSVLYHLKGSYLNPLGPFKKEVNIYAEVYSMRYFSTLSLHDDFWGSITKDEFIKKYAEPFLQELRKVVHGEVRHIGEKGILFSLGYRVDMQSEKERCSTRYDDMLECLPSILHVAREKYGKYSL